MGNILYHGSPSKYDILIPHQAYDTGFKEGCQNAVYATSNKTMALGFALGGIPDANGEPVKPLEVIEIEVNDYLDICIVEQKKMKFNK